RLELGRRRAARVALRQGLLELIAGNGLVGPRALASAPQDRRELPPRDQPQVAVERSSALGIPGPQAPAVATEQLDEHLLHEAPNLLARVAALDWGLAEQRMSDLGL